MASPLAIERVRDWVGADYDSNLISDMLDREGGSWCHAALNLLRRQRRTVAVDQGGGFSIAGDYSEDVNANASAVTVLDADIARLERLCQGGMTSVPIVSREPLR
jgi:hypothetical protein